MDVVVALLFLNEGSTASRLFEVNLTLMIDRASMLDLREGDSVPAPEPGRIVPISVRSSAMKDTSAAVAVMLEARDPCPLARDMLPLPRLLIALLSDSWREMGAPYGGDCE